mgnify:CR=1 FL=1
MRRFEREARDTAALGSIHTIDVYDFGVTEEGDFYYVMELLDGIEPRAAGAGVRTDGPGADRSICCGRSVTRSARRTLAVSSTATSSPPTSSSAGSGPTMTSSRCSTSAW